MATIENYINERKFAAESILKLIWDDYERAEQLKGEIGNETALVESEYNRAIAMQMYAEDPDDVMLGVGRYWENYFGADKDLYHKNEKMTDLAALLAARELSLTALSGNLLEHAKKGLALIYGNPNVWPIGRLVGSQALSKIILEARNQSIHIDEALKNGGYKKPDIGICFTLLENEINPVFSEYLLRDMSFEIIRDLGWTTYHAYHDDIIAIK